eukprot:CAMPEP_0174864300 /NCGR_PEP_ID=MMETSP1114-20130205/58121_1 /TAXON_ID=312471 /ORGANISM="Neobodo designis, Strain CCAP 1951/1" /LENGTH=82 /DNA_ID=CAMNT_0016099391 /DNA_START=356 /DNA_END=601 /DNA_ORIENTATION=-
MARKVRLAAPAALGGASALFFAVVLRRGALRNFAGGDAVDRLRRVCGVKAVLTVAHGGDGDDGTDPEARVAGRVRLPDGVDM